MSVNPVKAWSYSRYAKHTLCPLQFKLSVIDKVQEPGSAAMERGDRVHKGIAAYIIGRAPAAPPEALQHAAHVKLIEQVKAFTDKEVEQQWGYTRGWQATGWFGGDTWFRSVLDAGVMYEDMTFEDVDWKTGKRYGSNDDQMELQALSVMCRFKTVTHVTTRLAYLDTGDEEIAEFPATVKEKLIAKWERKVVPMFSDTVFAPRPNEKCRFCTFSRSNKGLCKFG